MSNSPAPERVTHEIIYEAPVTFLILQKYFVDTLRPGTATPSVKNVTRFRCANSSPITVTNLRDGSDGQELLLLGDGQTTLEHGTNIFLAGGSDLLLAANKLYHLVKFGDAWHQPQL